MKVKTLGKLVTRHGILNNFTTIFVQYLRFLLRCVRNLSANTLNVTVNKEKNYRTWNYLGLIESHDPLLPNTIDKLG